MLRFVLVCLFLAIPFTVSAAAAPGLDDLVARNIEAKGGIAALQAIQSLRLKGKLLVNNGQIELGYTELKKRPLQARAEASLQGLTAVQAYDGQQAWQIQPFQGRKDPEQLPLDDAKGLIEDADIDGPLVNYSGKHYQLAYLGREDVDGTDAYKIQVTKPDGDVLTVYLDPEHFLEIRIVSRRTVRGTPTETVSDFGDYEKVNGVWFPFAIATGAKGSQDRDVTQYDTGEANAVGDDTPFHFPAKAAAGN